MVRKITVDVPTHASSFEAYQRPVTVSLPAPPFDFTVTYNDRPETRPRSVPIRVTKKADKPPIVKTESVLDRVLQYALAMKFQCTVREAAEAVGASVSDASSAVSRAGIANRFLRSGKYPSDVRYGERQNGSVMRAAISAKRQGFNVDENLLPIDVLINDPSNA